jgi:hypothetical protein
VNLWLQGRHSFDRKYWNTLMTAECIKSLLGLREPAVTDRTGKPACHQQAGLPPAGWLASGPTTGDPAQVEAPVDTPSGFEAPTRSMPSSPSLGRRLV